MSCKGYTLVEMIVAIAIMSIMLGIVGFSYSLGKNFDTLNLENQRLASAIRNVRNRDFNGVVAYKKVCSTNVNTICESDSNCSHGTCGADLYPTGGYGLHIETNYKVCSADPSKSCFVNDDCSGGSCLDPSGRSNYTIFADFNGDGIFNEGKSGDEFVEEFKLPKNFSIILPGTAPLADILFKSGVVTIIPSASNPYSIEIKYASCAQTKNMKGRVSFDVNAKNISDELVSCP